MSSGGQLVPIHPLMSALQPLHNIILDEQQEAKDPDTEEPKSKKRKGGWPKGKKRKPPKEYPAPRAPTTGYVIFVNEKKVQLKMDHPDLPFTEITKMLGVQWSQLSMEEKQRYNNAADRDKQRYVRELKAYQNSEAYKAFLKRKTLNKVKDVCGIECVDSEFENEVFALSQLDGDENGDLFCRTCNQYFSSLHNKKEHLMGKQHLQNLTEEFEKETLGFCKEQEEELEGADDESEEEEEEETDLAHLCGLTSQHSFTSVDISLLEEFLIKQMKLREFELSELKATLDREMEKHENLNKHLQELQRQKINLETELENLKVCGGTLESQMDSLKMVPLFQFHIQVIDRDTPHSF
uniref:HMG box domain-containing protein n=1 Tax=Lepisosteus oculatus TaxID=7918 RepID=W5MVG6_LEPOC